MVIPGATSRNARLNRLLAGERTALRITKMSELRGAPVALVGSAQLMVRQLDKVLGYKMQYIDVDSDEAAFQKVRSGQAFAAFTIAGAGWRRTAA